MKVENGTNSLEFSSHQLTSSGSGTSIVVPCGALIAIRVSFCQKQHGKFSCSKTKMSWRLVSNAEDDCESINLVKREINRIENKIDP